MGRAVATTTGVHAELGAYSHVTRATGEVLHVSGQAPVALDGTTVEGDVTIQAEQVFANLEAVLASAGATTDDVVKVTTFLVDAADAAAVGAVRSRHFTAPFPASSVVVVAGLLDAAWRLEVEAVAVR